jgi:hypothetical protein
MISLPVESVSFNNLGYLKTKLPQDLYKSLLKECYQVQKNNKKMVSNLSGAGVPVHYDLKNKQNMKKLTKLLNFLVPEYEKQFPGLLQMKPFTGDLPLVFGTPWVNLQKKHEFLPNHKHEGVYSYNIWMSIPYEFSEELKNGGDHASSFEFSYLNVIGHSCSHFLKLGKEDEGTLILFPSQLQHCVYPFFTTNKLRVSIAGNILLRGDTKSLPQEGAVGGRWSVRGISRPRQNVSREGTNFLKR